MVVNAAQLATYSQAKQNLLATGRSRTAVTATAVQLIGPPGVIDTRHNEDVSVQNSGSLCKLNGNAKDNMG